jgi:hypothetical protein
MLLAVRVPSIIVGAVLQAVNAMAALRAAAE